MLLSFAQCRMDINIRDRRFDFLILLVLVDLFFIGLHVLYKFGVVSNPLYSIEVDWAYAEVFQYIKEYWIVALLIAAGVRLKAKVYFPWALLFVYLLFDDSLQVHENVGKSIATYFNIPGVFNLRSIDIGELLVSLFAGGSLLLFVAYYHRKSSFIRRRSSGGLFLMLLMVAFFGVFVDLLHSATPWFYGVFGLIEDGGEMLIFSMILWYAYSLSDQAPEEPPQQAG